MNLAKRLIRTRMLILTWIGNEKLINAIQLHNILSFSADSLCRILDVVEKFEDAECVSGSF